MIRIVDWLIARLQGLRTTLLALWCIWKARSVFWGEALFNAKMGRGLTVQSKRNIAIAVIRLGQKSGDQLMLEAGKEMLKNLDEHIEQEA